MFFLHILCCRIRFWPLLVSFILYFNDFLFIIWSNGQIISCRPLLYQTKIQLLQLIIFQALRTCVLSPWLHVIHSIVTGRIFLEYHLKYIQYWNIYKNSSCYLLQFKKTYLFVYSNWYQENITKYLQMNQRQLAIFTSN